MPVYDYSCDSCGREWEAFHPIENRDDERCCGIQARRRITTKARPVVLDYFSENLDAHITGPKQKRRRMREIHVEEAG